MNEVNVQMKNYLEYCDRQKCLDEKTLKAYRIDLRQFSGQIPATGLSEITPATLEYFIGTLHESYRPRTVKRKIASVRAFFHYLEYKDIISQNPFNKVQIRFREPAVLPRTIPLRTVEMLLSAIYRQHRHAKTVRQKRNALRDAAVTELLFATGMRISELCSLKREDINLQEGTVLIYGKGDKERRIQIGSQDVIHILREYQRDFGGEIQACGHFFAGRTGRALSDQAVRRMINKYTALASIELHITPHMFRHTFATSLLEADVDIRFIQEMLGHSSITITQLYTHVAIAKQRDILASKHPRKNFRLADSRS